MKAVFIQTKDSSPAGGGNVIAPPAAAALYEQSGYGRIEKTGKLRLACVEALYLIARGKIEVEGFSFDQLLAECAKFPGFLRSFTVYRDIRERGYVVTTGPQDYRIFPRGQRPGHGQSRYLLRVVSERDLVDLSVVLSEAQSAANMRKQFLLAAADDEHEITYYEIRIQKLQRKDEETTEYPSIPARLAGVSAYVTEDGSGITETLKNRWLGTLLDGKHMFLAPVETAWMLEHKQLQLEPEMGAEAYQKFAAENDPEFAEKMITYRYLRSLGFSPRTGYKYGHHFRVYTEQNNHSEMLVHACPHSLTLPMSMISRSVRLAHSVKKKMLFASINDDELTFIEFARMKL